MLQYLECTRYYSIYLSSKIDEKTAKIIKKWWELINKFLSIILHWFAVVISLLNLGRKYCTNSLTAFPCWILERHFPSKTSYESSLPKSSASHIPSEYLRSGILYLIFDSILKHLLTTTSLNWTLYRKIVPETLLTSLKNKTFQRLITQKNLPAGDASFQLAERCANGVRSGPD